MKYPYIVYWMNKTFSKYKYKKWQACTTKEKALRLKITLTKQGITSIWVAKDI